MILNQGKHFDSMNKKENLDVKKVFVGIAKNMARKKWQCLMSGCTDVAINSHLLQRHGELSHVIQNGHCYELCPIDLFKWKPEQFPFEFRKRGLQEAISLDIFCNHHDTDLFKPIESGNVDYSNYNNQVLLCFRTVCAEIRRKEFSIERYKRFSDSEILKVHRPDLIKIVPDMIKSAQKAITDLAIYKRLLEDEINAPSNSFTFIHETYPIMGIYASASFTIASEEETADFGRTLDCAFGHVIPTDTNTVFVFGYHNDHANEAILEFVNGWHGLNNEAIGEKLTGWFTMIEGWGMSPSLHDKISVSSIDRYFELLEKSVSTIAQNPNVGFNMFSGLL